MVKQTDPATEWPTEREPGCGLLILTGALSLPAIVALVQLANWVAG
ncbi:hypothetical protein VO57_015420 [Citromicrobium bathyomarinum]|nr:hypothetical protein [Citromicrobium sp. JL2201]